METSKMVMSLPQNNADEEQELMKAILEGNIEVVRYLLNNSNDHTALWWNKGNFIYEALNNKQLEIAKLLIKEIPLVNTDVSIFFTAILYGDLKIIEMLKERGYSLKMINDENKSLLHVFVQRVPVDVECSRILDYFLSKKMPINIKQYSTGFTPIHFAAECGNTEMIALLLSKKSRINPRTNQNQTPLHIAAANGKDKAAHILLQHSARLDLIDNSRKTPLCVAVEKQHMPTILVILSFKSFLKDEMLFDCALKTMNKSIISLLLQRGAQPFTRFAINGKTSLQVAVENGNLDIAKLLLEHNLNPNLSVSILHTAAEKNQPDIFELLLKYGANPASIDKKGRTALHFATKNGSLPIVTALLNSGCNVASLFTSEENSGYTPLHIAADCGHENLVKLFLEIGVPVNSVLNNGFTPIHLAALKGNAAMVLLLIQYGGNPILQAPEDFYGYFPMYLACTARSLDVVKTIYENSTRVINCWLEGFYSIYVAAYLGFEEIVTWFVNKGALQVARVINFLSPLYVAAQQGHVNIVNLLIEHGEEVNPTVTEGYKIFSTPLIAATRKGHEAVVATLLHHGADVDAKMDTVIQVPQSDMECFVKYGYLTYSELLSESFGNDYLPIHFAVRSGKMVLVELLLRGGADINSKTKNNATPLCVAVDNENAEIVAYLLKHGADPNADEDGLFVLNAAILKNNLEIVNLLLKFRATLNFTFTFDSKDGYTPLHLAIEKSSLAIVETLLVHGAAFIFNTGQDFPLHFATELGREDVIIKLVEYGASVNSVCSLGINPLFHTLKKGGKDIFKLLLKLGASFETKSCYGSSLLKFAVYGDMDPDLMQLIVECGGDVNERDEYNFSLVEYIIRDKSACYVKENTFSRPTNHDQFLEIFLKNGLDVNTRLRAGLDEAADTMLLFSVTANHAEIVELLLNYNADINILDKNGHVPFWYAVDRASSAIGYHTHNEADRKNLDLDSFHYENYYVETENNNFSVENHLEFQMFSKICEQCKRIARSFTQAIARIEAADGELNEENLFLINGDFVKRYYNRCRQEIERMKNTKVDSCVTYFDILISKEEKIAIYATNPDIINAFQLLDYRQQFPLYAENLIIRLERGFERKNLLVNSEVFLKKALNLKLPRVIVHKIFSYLSSVDLKNLCRVFNRLMFVKSR